MSEVRRMRRLMPLLKTIQSCIYYNNNILYHARPSQEQNMLLRRLLNGFSLKFLQWDHRFPGTHNLEI